MALVWQKQLNGTRYEVRTAGNSIRLYTNGIFHSQYNPQRPFSGQVWDLLTLPSCFYNEAHQAKRVLLLGVGGGAAIKQLDYLLPRAEITGIELDTAHLYIANRFFKTASKRTQLIESDARDWVYNYKGEKFDLIIDDVFGEENNEPVRAIPADAIWMKKISKLLSQHGMLICNFPDRESLFNCGIFSNSILWNRYPSIFQFSTPHTYNRVGVFLTHPSSTKQLRENLKSKAEKIVNFNIEQLRYTARKLK